MGLNLMMKESIYKKTSATGFEPVRVTPADFESASLTTRTY